MKIEFLQFTYMPIREKEFEKGYAHMSVDCLIDEERYYIPIVIKELRSLEDKTLLRGIQILKSKVKRKERK